MDVLIPLSVVVPLASAGLLTAASRILRVHRRVLDALAIGTALTVLCFLGILVFRSNGHLLVYWFGGFHPSHGIALGIDFSVGQLNAGLAALTATLVVASMVFSWRYFEEDSTWYQALMLVFLAGMVGFCLTGDLFDLFVWFEVMSVAAYGLTAYRSEERGPLQGAINFAVTNSVGAYLTLTGIALVYARTGALNMAQIQSVLARHRPDVLVVVAFVLVITGFLAKASVAPFHFWLADAHAVAPTPVCVLFSGVMVELGLFGVARVYWSVFGAALGHEQAITQGFLALGTLTAIVGAIFSFRQRHIKRLLAFSTVSHAGMFLLGAALLSPLGLAGASAYVLGHGLVKASLFLCAGVVLHRLGSVNETKLHGKGTRLRTTGVIFIVAGLGLSDLPPCATYLGATWIGTSAGAHGYGWVSGVIIAATILTGGAVLRVGGGVFFGLGDPPSEDPRMATGADEESSETSSGKNRSPLTMTVPAAVLAIGAFTVGAWPHLGQVLARDAVAFESPKRYAELVLGLSRPGIQGVLSAPPGIGVAAVLVALGSAIGAIVVALMALYRKRIPVLRAYGQSDVVQRYAMAIQSGVVNDYIAWLVLGVACFGGALALSIR